VHTLLLLTALPGQFTDNPTFSKQQQQSALEATVRIYYPAAHVEGSAVIVSRRGPFVYLLTAAHNVTVQPDKGDDIELYLYNAKKYPKLVGEANAKVRARMPNEDLAVLEAVFDTPGMLPICPKGQTKIRKPFPVMTVGCVADGPPVIEFDRVLDVDFVPKPNGTKANYWRAERAQAVGRSGGPLVDARGYVLGICSGTMRQKGYYTEISEIHAALDRNGMDWLYAKPTQAGK
jgi:S1-C subfamily serine protease